MLHTGRGPPKVLSYVAPGISSSMEGPVRDAIDADSASVALTIAFEQRQGLEANAK